MVWEEQHPSHHQSSSPPPHVRHLNFSFSSLEIYLFLPCLLPAHSSQSVSPDISSHSLSSFTPRLLSNFPALAPIHLPLCVPASLDHNIAHSLPLSTSILSAPCTTFSLPPRPSFIHSSTLKDEEISENEQRAMQICAQWGARLHFTLQLNLYTPHMCPPPLRTHTLRSNMTANWTSSSMR